MHREQVYMMLIIERVRSGSALSEELCARCWADAGIIIEGAQLAQAAELEEASAAELKAAATRKRTEVK